MKQCPAFILPIKHLLITKITPEGNIVIETSTASDYILVIVLRRLGSAHEIDVVKSVDIFRGHVGKL